MCKNIKLNWMACVFRRFMVVEVYDEDISQVINFYQSGADMAFYFDLVFLNRSCGGKCIQGIVNKLLDHLPEGKWPNFVVSKTHLKCGIFDRKNSDH